jgi:hypothetical protein
MGCDQHGTPPVGKSSGCSSVWGAAGIRPAPTLAPDVRPLRAPSPGAITPADLDRMPHVWQNRLTGGRSPSTVGLAFLDWAAHAANAPFQTARSPSSAALIGSQNPEAPPFLRGFFLAVIGGLQ